MASDQQKTSGHKRKTAIDASLESLESIIPQERNMVEFMIMQSAEDKRRREEREEREERRREEREIEERRYREERESRNDQRQREMMMFMATFMKGGREDK